MLRAMKAVISLSSRCNLTGPPLCVPPIGDANAVMRHMIVNSSFYLLLTMYTFPCSRVLWFVARLYYQINFFFRGESSILQWKGCRHWNPGSGTYCLFDFGQSLNLSELCVLFLIPHVQNSINNYLGGFL